MLVELAGDQGTTKEGGNKGPKPLTFPAKSQKRGTKGRGLSGPQPRNHSKREKRGVEGGRPTGDGGGPASRAPADHRGTTTERDGAKE